MKNRRVVSKLIKPTIMIMIVIVIILFILFLFRTHGGSLATKSYLNGNDETYDPKTALVKAKDILHAMDDGTFNEEMFGRMYLSKDELKTILEAVDESETKVSNTITYEYYFEEWTTIGKTEEGNDVWGWQTGYAPESIVITNEPHEKEHRVDWQTIYILCTMGSLQKSNEWKDEHDVDTYGTPVVGTRLDLDTLYQAMRVFNYEYEYLFDGARSPKTYFSWDELESICYRYIEEGDWEAESYPDGEYHIRTCKKIPATAETDILNAMEHFEYEFCKNTHCTPRYQKPNNWEVDYRTWYEDPDVFTRACQLVTPNFSWSWYLSLMEELPGTEDLVNEETHEVTEGLFTKYRKYHEKYINDSYIKEKQEEPYEKGVIVGEELTELVDEIKARREGRKSNIKKEQTSITLEEE